MISQNKNWHGDVGDGTSIEVPWTHYRAAPDHYRDDPLFWRAQSSWEESSPTLASIPPEWAVSRCKQCLRGYVFSSDDLAWLATAFLLTPCGHSWQDVVPMLQWLSIQTEEERAKNLQNCGDCLITSAIPRHFQTLSQRWGYMQSELRKSIGSLSREMSAIMEDIGRKNTYDTILWQVAEKRVPSPTMATVSTIRHVLGAGLAEEKLRYVKWTGETIGRSQARGAVETYIIALAQFEWFFPTKTREGVTDGTHE